MSHRQACGKPVAITPPFFTARPNSAHELHLVNGMALNLRKKSLNIALILDPSQISLGHGQRASFEHLWPWIRLRLVLL